MGVFARHHPFTRSKIMVFKGPLEPPPVSEADIQAYTDGSIAGERAASVRRYLAARPAEWRRILFYRRLNAQIRRSFAGGGIAAHGERGPVAHPVVRRGGLRLAVMAFALAVMLAVAAAAWLAAAAPAPQVLNDAAVMVLMEAANAPPGGQAGNTGNAVDGPFNLKVVGLHLVASGTLDLGPFASAQRYVYENGDGKKIVLLGARAGLAKDQPQWSAHRIGALRLIGWTAHGMRWVLAGDAQTHGLMRAADVATMSPAGGGRG